MLIAALLVGCGSVPLKPQNVAGDVWCFPVQVKLREGKAMYGCADKEALCRRALDSARRYGRMAGATAIGACRQAVLR